MPETCPLCCADLNERAEVNGQTLLGSRLIGYEIRGVYDGTLYWVCPDCQCAFQAFNPTTNPGLHATAQFYIDKHNYNDSLREEGFHHG